MTRKDLIDKVAEEFGIKKKDAEAVVKFLFKEITEALKKGERVSIQGFGVFDLKEQKERKIRNPRTGEVIEVPRKKKVYFRPTFKL
ncbi:DNA-binding protein HU-beta [Thermovibrio guaymasensis]|uniref:DNA-binding protein HU-beta n=1 Tax=Thermovibrio guaymasensis TaxID=240167 RepID=A0A420W5C9_9BACT|nr:HU family DNA-binding protein [Thermovibrio guaymasensis]RKQ59094.1 DNA-binding protein HU-beta [Thermovibrio guaymasensis]